jgi:hypothetical protein
VVQHRQNSIELRIFQGIVGGCREEGKVQVLVGLKQMEPSTICNVVFLEFI